MTDLARHRAEATQHDGALVSLEGVTVAFGGVLALNDVSFTIAAEDGIVGIIGPNGAGKSTCLSVIAGARPATSGAVTALGRPLGRRPNATRLARAGVVRTFQIPRPFAEMTIRENVVVALASSRRARTAELVTQADELLERLGLAAMAGSPAGSLPLAMRKKLEVGRAVASSPKLLLLDEVFEGLSDTEIDDMVRILRELHADGIHLVLVEHVLRALRQLAQTLIVFEKGQVLAQGDVETVLSSAEVKEAYLGDGGGEA
ncbi:ATP-binding cassette domain-containing protein [Phycicoccus endophyticus]|uniref:ATP-binding cassette domain-containing protein n=1 Tax=Phycicoccus endophyticus TaxID=1690220 RepID=A0A7G9QZD0_9MICO|nr:ATP-binding cassette domain-containing protein [Phycicoccus endophyticus]NHI19061.1 ATP-binding cassette domain-containing protein [Phycicoccus endophyticus]QNN48705.1 ATP-binding cassette domain-containing protein [Phycicoccus endophyticus]GGL32549.1 ABC transporter ATP-binding protein [Phycicoccus endophyticus]